MRTMNFTTLFGRSITLPTVIISTDFDLAREELDALDDAIAQLHAALGAAVSARHALTQAEADAEVAREKCTLLRASVALLAGRGR